MTRARHTSGLLVVVIAAAAAWLGGCAAGAPTEESDTSVEALIDTVDDTPGDTAEAAEEADEGSTTGVARIGLDDRNAPSKNDGSWAQGEPHPIPWHTKSTGGTGSAEDPTGDPDSNLPPTPSAPTDR